LLLCQGLLTTCIDRHRELQTICYRLQHSATQCTASGVNEPLPFTALNQFIDV